MLHVLCIYIVSRNVTIELACISGFGFQLTSVYMHIYLMYKTWWCRSQLELDFM